MRQMIKDFGAKDKVEIFLRLTDIQFRKTTTNDDYASMLGYDGEKLIDVKLWKLPEEDKEKLINGEVYFINGSMREYQGKLQLNISEFRIANASDSISLEDFYEKAKIPKAELESIIYSYIEKIDNEIIKKIVTRVISLYHDKYFEYPAATLMHHNYFSGLAYHVYSMLQASDKYLEIYPFLNRSLVYGGIIIHDLGKVIELSGAKGTEYTKEGNLIGHISLAFGIINQIAVSMQVENTEEVLALQHILLAHHGQLEYGSPKEPAIAEAMLIFLLDYADSRLAALEKEIEVTEKGAFTNQIFALGRKNFYIPNIE